MNETRDDRIAAAKARMGELAMKFIGRTRGDLRSMREGLEKLGTGDGSGLAEIHHLAHRMSGTGSTFGFEALGERAASLEAEINALPPGALPDVQLRARLASRIGALESQLAEDAARWMRDAGG